MSNYLQFFQMYLLSTVYLKLSFGYLQIFQSERYSHQCSLQSFAMLWHWNSRRNFNSSSLLITGTVSEWIYTSIRTRTIRSIMVLVSNWHYKLSLVTYFFSGCFFLLRKYLYCTKQEIWATFLHFHTQISTLNHSWHFWYQPISTLVHLVLHYCNIQQE